MPGQDFVDFYRHHYAWLKRYAWSRYESLDADDLAQDTLVRVCRSWHNFNPDNACAWLKKVVDHAAIDELRRQQRTSVDPDVDVDSMSSTLARQNDPAEQAVRAEYLRLMRELMRELPQHHREVLTRKFFDEASYDVISKELGVSYDTARQRVHRAVKALTRLASKRHIVWLALPVALSSALGALRRLWMSAPTGFAMSSGAIVFAVGYGTGIFGPDTGIESEMTMRPPTTVAPSPSSTEHSERSHDGTATASKPTSATTPPPAPADRTSDDDATPPPRSPMTVTVDVPPPDTGPGTKQSHDVRIPTPAGDVTADNEANTTGPLLYPVCDSGVDLCE